MQIKANSPEHYLEQLPDSRKQALSNLRDIILKNLPAGFTETINYGMIGYVIPHSLYPAGYHCDPKLPLPFLSIASQKNYVAVYHMGIYTNKDLMDWFVREFPNHSKAKLDMGKSCIRFKHIEHIPYQLIGELASKITAEKWISHYDENIKNTKKNAKG